jgi:hypothetical protein
LVENAAVVLFALYFRSVLLKFFRHVHQLKAPRIVQRQTIRQSHAQICFLSENSASMAHPYFRHSNGNG